MPAIRVPSMPATLSAAFGMCFGRPLALLAAGPVSSRRKENAKLTPSYEPARLMHARRTQKEMPLSGAPPHGPRQWIRAWWRGRASGRSRRKFPRLAGRLWSSGCRNVGVRHSLRSLGQFTITVIGSFVSSALGTASKNFLPSPDASYSRNRLDISRV
jgi:hypothetical protein